MTRFDDVRSLISALEQGRLSRRDFVARAVALGLSLSMAGMLVAACRRPGERSGARGDGALGELEPELNIYNWSDYVAPETIAGFEREFGVRVRYDTYESNEEMLAKLAAGASDYDIVVPTNHVVPTMIARGMVAPLAPAYLPNLQNLAPAFVSPLFDPGNAYTVPYQWGTTGYAYRTDRLPAPPDSWAVFHDPAYRGRCTQMDDMREVIGAWLRFRGHSLNATGPAQLAEARASALLARRNLKAYISAPVKGQLVSGEIWVAQLWDGDTRQARAEQPAIGYVLPTEGCTIWTDCCMIPARAPHKRAAHEFLNYLLRPEVSAAISNVTRYGSPNQAAMHLIRDPVPYPTATEFKRLEFQADLGDAVGLWERLWAELKSA
jgi:spermidine/putrescine-binding protein